MTAADQPSTQPTDSERKELAVRASQMMDRAINAALNSWPGTEQGKQRFHSIAMNIALRDKNLIDCTPQSKLMALTECARLGLVPDRVLGHIWLVPFTIDRGKDTERKEVQVIPGYKGYIELARRSGLFTTIDTGVVFANDLFEFEKGTNAKLLHKPYWHVGQASSGDLLCTYCVASIRNETTPQIEVMHISEIMASKARSKSGNRGPWVTDFEAMARICPIRRAAKLWSLSPELARLLDLQDRVDLAEPQFRSAAPTQTTVMELTDDASDDGTDQEVE